MLSLQETNDHRVAMSTYHELSVKFNNNPYSLSTTDQNNLINAIKYLKMEVFTLWSSVEKADDLLMRVNSMQKASQNHGEWY